MSAPVVIPWLPSTSNTGAIASSQNTTANNQNLVLNSTVSALPQGPYVYDRVIRSVSITRTDAGGDVVVTITGMGSPVDDNGNPTQVIGSISENITTTAAGPNESVNIYSQILSISVATSLDGISAGFGTFGITDYVFMDYNRIWGAFTVQLQFINRVTVTAAVYASLSKPQTPNADGSLDNFYPIPAFQVIMSSSTNQLQGDTGPLSIMWATISGTSTDSVYFTVLQQGIR